MTKDPNTPLSVLKYKILLGAGGPSPKTDPFYKNRESIHASHLNSNRDRVRRRHPLYFDFKKCCGRRNERASIAQNYGIARLLIVPSVGIEPAFQLPQSCVLSVGRR